MTVQSISQAGVEVLYRVSPGAVVSQAGVEVLHRVLPSFAISQAGVEVLHKGESCTTRKCQIWTIERTDGEVYRFTSLDRDFEYPPGSGVIYRSCDSLVPSASEDVSEVDAAGNMDLSGAIGEGDGAISLGDLYAGRFDGALAEAWKVSWDSSGSRTGRRQRLLRGNFGPVEIGETGYKVELLGDGARLLQTPIISNLGPDCRWKFGDPVTCRVDLAPLTVTGTVDSGSGQRSFTDAARGEAAGYFRRGEVTFLTGDNAGVSAEIKEHGAGGVFTVWPRLPFAPLAGDTYSMTPGCTNLKAAEGGCNGCTAWDNLLRYGGYDKVQGRDKRSAAANVR